MPSLFKSKFVSVGAYLPEKIVTNADLAEKMDTSDDWIVQRTGIMQRHIAAKDEKTSDMATRAAFMALERAGLKGADIDCIVLATTTPDQTFPATAVTVQDQIGMGDRGFAFDVQAVCSGFIYALAVADNFIKTGQVRRALVIGAEKFSSLLDWDDRTTAVLFGDGAGAIILERGEITDASGILSTHLHSEGAMRDLLYVDGGVSTTQTTGVVKMNGKEVFRHAVTRMSEVVVEALAHNNLKPSDIDWLIPHQANKRIIESTAQKLNLSSEKIVLTVSKHGNTSAASIPLAFNVAYEEKKLTQNSLILLEAMGGGLTWGACLLRL